MVCFLDEEGSMLVWPEDINKLIERLRVRPGDSVAPFKGTESVELKSKLKVRKEDNKEELVFGEFRLSQQKKFSLRYQVSLLALSHHGLDFMAPTVAITKKISLYLHGFLRLISFRLSYGHQVRASLPGFMVTFIGPDVTIVIYPCESKRLEPRRRSQSWVISSAFKSSARRLSEPS